ncbi:MAG: cyclodeaminase/cyclohydrolase family protein [Phycisphaerales bacterium]|nr:cyclodeaminase/cyclohydrolase family protein [Phycisphaerales bacterium]
MSFADHTIESFTAAVADRVAVPGGGAVAGVTLAQAAALGSMVIRFSRGKKAYAEHDAMLAGAETRLDAIRSEALELADRDAEGFEALARLFPLAEDDPERNAAWPTAVEGAMTPPREVVALATETLQLCEGLVGRSSRMLRSDLAIAARLAAVAADAAAWNVRMNLTAYSEIEGREEDARTIAQATEKAILEAEHSARKIAERCRS